MRVKNILRSIIIISLFSLACNLGLNNDKRPASNAVVVNVIAHTGLTSWLESAVTNFNQAGLKTTGGEPVYAVLNSVEAGQVVANISGGSQPPDMWIPDREVWADVLADRGQASFQGNCLSLAESPLVIAMWRPIAEALGWPGRSLGWLDIGSLAADPSAWAYYSGGQFGPTLRLGHTHPGLSDTGASTLLSIVQAAESKLEAVTVADIQKPIVQASVGAFEGAVAWFSPSTASLGQTMRQRGPNFLGAAVVYENIVVTYGSAGDDRNLDIIPIYPFEGTLMATNPACINTAAAAETQEAAILFRDYLLQAEAQQLALANGLRPVNDQVPAGPPLDAAHGVDLSQPERRFGAPGVETLYAVQEVWQAARKDVNLALLLDISGSMDGGKMENMRRAAIQFVEQMGQDDRLTLIAFSTEPTTYAQHVQVGSTRAEIIKTITSLQAGGDTALYDAIGLGSRIITMNTSSQTSNALIVLTDGMDTSSAEFSFDQRLIEAATANNTIVFAIAYGDDADEGLLGDLAQQANGNFYLGNEANIGAIYEEMSAAFGGSVGIGR